MSEAEEDTRRAILAGRAIIDGRSLELEFAPIMVTLEHAVASVLLCLIRDPRKASAMLNEGLLQGVEGRLALYASKEKQR